MSSASLAVGSAAAFLVLVTLLSFVPEGGLADGRTADRGPGGPADVMPDQSPGRRPAERLADRSAAWRLRGALPPDASPPGRERMAQRAPS